MIPEDGFLPTPAARSLLLSLVLAHRSRMTESALRADPLDKPTLNGEAALAGDVADWLETVPVRGS